MHGDDDALILPSLGMLNLPSLTVLSAFVVFDAISLRQSKAVSNILKQCYGDPDAVTDELVNYILKPGLEPGAVKASWCIRVCLALPSLAVLLSINSRFFLSFDAPYT